jgi:hypothetical protein
LLQQEPRKGAETDSWVAFSKETAAEVHRRLKWVPCNIRRLCSGILRLPSGILTLDSGILTLGSGNAAVAHVHRLKWNQQKGKLILSPWVFWGVLGAKLDGIGSLTRPYFLSRNELAWETQVGFATT